MDGWMLYVCLIYIARFITIDGLIFKQDVRIFCRHSKSFKLSVGNIYII
jgi:hypothetical protein